MAPRSMHSPGPETSPAMCPAMCPAKAPGLRGGCRRWSPMELLLMRFPGLSETLDDLADVVALRGHR